MDSKFGKGVNTPVFNLELERWRKFIKGFEIAVIGACLGCKEGKMLNLERRLQQIKA